jgi:hypothetical protein
MNNKRFSSFLLALILPIPFSSQAPLAQWSDSRFQDACEETSVIMAMKWVKGEKIADTKAGKEAVSKEIKALAAYQEKKYKNYHDTSAKDTMKRLINGYYGYDKAELKIASSSEDLIKELDKGRALIVPTNGRLLGNPNFSGAGPEYHMLLIKGYDSKTSEFITNDPGTRRGRDFRYSYKVLFKAINDYPSGKHEKRLGNFKNFIAIWR